MRTWGLWGYPTALLVALSLLAPAMASETNEAEPKPAAKESSSPNWFSRWLPWGSKKPDKAKATQPGKEASGKPAPAKVQGASAMRAREEAALLRRLDVCDQLMQIAVQKNDEALLSLAERLAERAGQVYAQRTGNLPSSRAVLPVNEPNPTKSGTFGRNTGKGAGAITNRLDHDSDGSHTPRGE